MIGLTPRCGQSKFRKFWTYNLKSLPKDLHWVLIVPMQQHGLYLSQKSGKGDLAVHNLTRLESWWFKRRMDKGIESADEIHVERY